VTRLRRVLADLWAVAWRTHPAYRSKRRPTLTIAPNPDPPGSVTT
jgi:hypothetical protein